MSDEVDSFDVDIMSDRAGVIAMVALFEDAFADQIRSRLVPLSKTIDDDVFGDRGPLGTLSAKIDIGFALGMYGKETKSNLHNIRRIRNLFAHRHEAKDFDHPRVMELSNNLKDVYQWQSQQSDEGRRKLHSIIIKILLGLSLGAANDRPSSPAELP